MIEKIKKTFFNKEFLTFCIIGFLAYLVHQVIYLIYLKGFKLWDDQYHLLSTAICFSLSSIFAYFANAKWTYSQTASTRTAVQSTLVYVVKFVVVEGITIGIMALTKRCLDSSNVWYKIIETMLPLILTVITMILQFIAFNFIFKKREKTETGGDVK